MRSLQSAFRFLLGIVFIFSAYTKFLGPGFFEITLIDQGLLSSRGQAQHAARFLIGFEFALGLLMLLPYYTKQLMAIASLMLIGFTIHLGYLWAIGDNENCGCFGEMISMSPAESIAKNILMLAVSVWLWIKSPSKATNQPILFGGAMIIITSMWVFLPIPDQSEFPVNQYTNFSSVGRTDLSSGEKLVAILNLECEHCQELSVELGKMNKTNKLPDVYAFYFKEGETTVEQFEQMTNTSFPYVEIDVNTFFDLIGESPPRVYVLNDGAVDAIIDEDIANTLDKRYPQTNE
ncbi:MAG: DoxX family protein [Flavobacteriaceae bacterium]